MKPAVVAFTEAVFAEAAFAEAAFAEAVQLWWLQF